MGCHENEPDTSYAGSEEQMRRELLASALSPIITDFLDTLNYEPPSKTNTDALRAGMLKYAASSGVPYTGSKHAHQCFMTGLSVAAVSTTLTSHAALSHGTGSCSPTLLGM